jgi:hypothetical protein
LVNLQESVVGDGEQMLVCGDDVGVLVAEVCVTVDTTSASVCLVAIRSMHQGQVHQ